jgi:FkbM family methyltransferase
MLNKTDGTTNDSVLWVTANKLMWWRRLHRPEVQLPVQLCGNSVRYTWPVIEGWLTSESVIYSFGVGRDASFEQEVVARYGSRINAFDPSPRSVEWARSQRFPPQLQFFELGISDEEGYLRLAPPQKSTDVSFSAVVPPTKGEMTTVVRARPLPSIMHGLGHQHLDLLKMDIEGSEYRVVRHLLSATSLRPPQLLVEYHQGFYGCTREMTMNSVRLLHEAGYRIFWLSDRGLEYGFVHESALDGRLCYGAVSK